MRIQQIEEDVNTLGLSVADHVTAMLAYWDKDLVCRFANVAYLDWFGRKREDMIGKMTLKELLGPVLFEKNRTYIEGALNGKPQIFEREIPIPTGGTRHSLANYFPHIKDGEVVGFFVHVADISTIKLLEEELLLSNKIVTEQNKRLLNFAHVVSHNLSSYANNLAAILDLYIHANTETEKGEMLNYLKKISQGFSETVGNLNEIVKSEDSSKVISERVNLRTYIEKVIKIVRIQLKSCNGTVLNYVDPEIYVHANAAYMESIILNFMTNAIKYRDARRSLVIELSCHAENRGYVLKIKDNGLGIDLSKYGKELFGMYKTFHGNPDAKGIGLFITRFQVESMGGTIDVESEVNKGTVFSIHLKGA